MHLADGLQAPAEQVENAARPLAELQQTLLARQVALYEEKRALSSLLERFVDAGDAPSNSGQPLLW